MLQCCKDKTRETAAHNTCDADVVSDKTLQFARNWHCAKLRRWSHAEPLLKGYTFALQVHLNSLVESLEERTHVGVQRAKN